MSEETEWKKATAKPIEVQWRLVREDEPVVRTSDMSNTPTEPGDIVVKTPSLDSLAGYEIDLYDKETFYRLFDPTSE